MASALEAITQVIPAFCLGYFGPGIIRDIRNRIRARWAVMAETKGQEGH